MFYGMDKLNRMEHLFLYGLNSLAFDDVGTFLKVNMAKELVLRF